MIVNDQFKSNLSYDELEERNLKLRNERISGVSSDKMREIALGFLKKEKWIRAVIVCFSDLEGRFQTLDYDKGFLMESEDNLTFDGSSIHGFTDLSNSDLRLRIDWTSFRFVPEDVFGKGKVLVFANVCDANGDFYESDFRSQLYRLSREFFDNEGVVINVAPEIEGFLFEGTRSEQKFNELEGFKPATMSSYFSSLPQGVLRVFMDSFADGLRVMGFRNEKDHPEVAPAQFELNFRYTWAIDAADQIQIYKLLAREIASSMGLTASFLPKPVQNLNGNGMHTNISLSKNGKNLFYDVDGEVSLSSYAHKFIFGVLSNAKGLCLLLNSSVNSYRRLDPNFEAPNAIKFSDIDRGSMIRIPMGNEKSSRVEVRTVAPDVNPYLAIYALLKAGLEGAKLSDTDFEKAKKEFYNDDVQVLPATICDAMDEFEKSDFVRDVMGKHNHDKYLNLKHVVADRSPKELGTRVKTGEVLYHHEVTNQCLWGQY